MIERRAYDKLDEALASIRIDNGVGDAFLPILEERVALLSRDEQEHTTFELCYVRVRDKVYLSICTLVEERLNKILIITTEEAIALQEALKELIDANTLKLTAPITDE